MRERDEYYKLSCDLDHVFHIQCLENWRQRNQTCPLCRSEIVIVYS